MRDTGQVVLRMMKLIDLEPRWITPNFFIFRCPCCQKAFLTCKNIVLSREDVWNTLRTYLGEDWNEIVVPPKAETAWNITGSTRDPNASFPTDLTVTPSIDASASGHWHGFITNGEIT
jgi:hypothetical protein